MTVTSRVGAGVLEASRDLRAVEGRAQLGMREHEILLAGVGGALRPAVELADEPICHRDGASGREVGLALGRVLPARVRLAYSDALS